jgi:2-oxoisovalerate dehydrogenase E1 component
VFLEPIARYHDTALHEIGDDEWTAAYDPSPIAVGDARTHPSGVGEDQLTILTWGNGLHMSLQAQRRLLAAGVAAAVVDLRWLAPLPIEAVFDAAMATGKALVVDETRRTGGVGEGIVAELVEHGFTGAIHRVAGRDSFIPLGAAANLVLVSVDDIVAAATRLATT